MEVNVTNELYIFLCTALAGGCIGLIYDLFRVIRQRVRVTGFFNDVQDIIFWLLSAGIMFYVVFTTNNGQVRWYEFLGLILGLILYLSTISWAVRRALDWFLDFLVKFFLFCFKILLTPLLFLYNIVSRPIMYVGRILKRLVKKLQKLSARKVHSAGKQIKIKLTKK